MEIRTEPMTEEHRRVLKTKIEQAEESGDAAGMTAAVLTAAIVVALRLLHQSVAATLLLAVPMAVSGVAAYLHCRQRAWRLEQDLYEDTVVAGSGQAELTKLQGSAAGSYVVEIPGRRVRATSRRAGLRGLLVRPEANTFFGQFAFAPHSGQLLALRDRRGRPIFDAHEQEVLDAFEEEFSRS
jgi:hypothetical protein